MQQERGICASPSQLLSFSLVSLLSLLTLEWRRGSRTRRRVLVVAMLAGAPGIVCAQYSAPPPAAPAKAPANAPRNATANAPATTAVQNSVLGPDEASNHNYCPQDERPPISAMRDTRQSWWARRSQINADYLILEYDADPLANPNVSTRWYDYHQWFSNPSWTNVQPIVRNGSFIPVVYTKERILVHVCGLKFTDMVTVTNNPTGVAEGGADIRGGAVATPAATLAPALDSLQTVGLTGSAATIGGLGFGATPSLTTTNVTGITQGTVSHAAGGALTYSDANITASPEELALLMYAAVRNGMDLADTIKANFGYDKEDCDLPQVLRVNVLQVDSGGSKGAEDQAKGDVCAVKINSESENLAPRIAAFDMKPPNHLDHITLELLDRLKDVGRDSTTQELKTSVARFDEDMTNVQNLSNELTTFFAAVAGQGFGVRAVTVWNNYVQVEGTLDLIRNGPTKNDCVPLTEAQRTEELAEQAGIKATDAEVLAEAAANTLRPLPAGPKRVAAQKDYDTKRQAAIDAMTAFRKAVTDAGNAAGTATPSSTNINCDAWEKTDYAEFIRQYDIAWNALVLKDSDPARQNEARTWHPYDMFAAIFGLRSEIDAVAATTGTLFAEMNEWNDSSTAEQSDFITPVSSNALERISIVVQHGYTPFILNTYTGGTAPTATVAAAPTTTTTASTSTPAHAVKTVLVEVHRRANFNLVGGAMVMRIPTATYAVQAGTTPATLPTTGPVVTPTPGSTGSSGSGSGTPVTYTYTFTYSGMCNGTPGVIATYTDYASATPPALPTQPNAPTPPAYSCAVQTQSGKYQVAGMVGMAWFPLGRDYFPRRNGLTIYAKDLIPSLFVATSVTSLGNFAVGLNEEPFSGLDIMIGQGFSNTTVLPSGVTPSTVLPSGYTLPTVTEYKKGLTFGVGFDLGVFMQMFTKGGSSASLP